MSSVLSGSSGATETRRAGNITELTPYISTKMLKRQLRYSLKM
ncbi:hypothetical protein ACLB6K_14790 [Microcystis aeruginosa FACHB-524]